MDSIGCLSVKLSLCVDQDLPSEPFSKWFLNLCASLFILLYSYLHWGMVIKSAQITLKRGITKIIKTYFPPACIPDLHSSAQQRRIRQGKLDSKESELKDIYFVK